MDEPVQPTTNSTLQYTPKVVQSIDANFSEQIRTSNGSLRSSQDKPEDTKQNLRRDLYGFELRKDLIVDYSKFVDHFVSTLQQQTEKFDKYMLENFTSLDEGVLPNTANDPSFTEMVKKGIPPKYRCLFWQLFSGTKQIIQMTAGVYEQVLFDYKDQRSEAILQIEKDVARTFANNVGSFSRDFLRRVLIAYSWKNKSIGYCQAMNFIGAGLLVFMGEEEVFWVLSFIVEKLLPDYFNQALTGSRVDAKILLLYLRRRLPKLYKHFTKVGFDINLVCTHWLMCLFITAVPYETAFRIWDYTFLVGPRVIFEVALAIFKLCEKKLLALNDDTEIGLCLNQEASKLFNADKLFEVGLKPLKNKRIVELREQYKQEIEKGLKEKEINLQLEDLSQKTYFEIDELETLYDQFMHLNPSPGGTLSLENFKKVIKNVFPDWGEDEYFIVRLYQVMDETKDNMVDFKDLIQGISTLCRGTFEDKLQFCFKMFDNDSSGFVDKEKVRKMLASIYLLYTQHNFETELNFFVDMIFQVADKSKDDKLDFTQFKEAVMTQPFIVKCFRLDQKSSVNTVELAPEKESEELVGKEFYQFLKEKLKL